MAIGTVSNDQLTTSLQQTQTALATSLTREATGKRLQSPADGPAAFAIATNLQVQVAAFNEASQNVQTAFNATNVATGALSQTSAILGQLRNLAIAGVNDFLSPADRAALQVAGEPAGPASEYDRAKHQLQRRAAPERYVCRSERRDAGAGDRHRQRTARARR